MSGVINKIKDAITGDNPNKTATGTGVVGSEENAGNTVGPHNTDTGNRLDPRVDSDNSRYGSTTTDQTGLGGNRHMNDGAGPGMPGNTARSHEGLSQGVESSRITNMGNVGTLGQDSTRGVGQGFPGVTGNTGSTDKYGEGVTAAGGAGIAGLEHHRQGQTGQGLTGNETGYGSNTTGSGLTGGNNTGYGSNTTGGGLTGGNTGYGSNTTGGGLTGTGDHDHHRRHERELEAGAAGAGLAGAEHHHHKHHQHGNTGRGDLESRIEPHQATGGNIEDYTSPSAFSHGNRHGLGGGSGGLGGNTTGGGLTGGQGYDSNTTGGGLTGTGNQDHHRRHERELEAGAVGAGIAGAEHHHHNKHQQGSGVTAGGMGNYPAGSDITGGTGRGSTQAGSDLTGGTGNISNTPDLAGGTGYGATGGGLTGGSTGYGSNTTGQGLTGNTGNTGYGSNTTGGGLTGNQDHHRRHERELEAGAAGAGLAEAEHHHHKHHNQQDTGMTGSGYGGSNTSGYGSNTGPHDSSTLNKLDPRTDSVQSTGFGAIHPVGDRDGRSSNTVDVNPENTNTQGGIGGGMNRNY